MERNVQKTKNNKQRGSLGYRVGKRLFDIAASLLALTVLFVPMFLVGLIVTLTSKGGPFYCDRRVGKNGKEFTLIKFRTMVRGADSQKEALQSQNEVEGGVIFKIKNDPRVTKVGKVLRKTSIDELPQLLNILVGHMSVIGPRPGTPKEVAQYPEDAMRRLSVPQGLSGEWQVHRSDVFSFAEMVAMDLDYIDNKRSLGYDFKLICQTVGVVFHAKGQ